MEAGDEIPINRTSLLGEVTSFKEEIRRRMRMSKEQVGDIRGAARRSKGIKRRWGSRGNGKLQVEVTREGGSFGVREGLKGGSKDSGVQKEDEVADMEVEEQEEGRDGDGDGSGWGRGREGVGEENGGFDFGLGKRVC